ncbi:FUSC family protein [Labrys sp. KB_33_2]|uniref:FUSC family protein n=1 Tax=Labrys sp. KB_33_2 TaxID=3237479 RepID=UPI003F92CFE8
MTAGFPLPTVRDWVFSLKAFSASMVALYIALAAGLERPYWAMAAVYVVANPLAGATTSKALYRALGTFIGAAGSILLLPIFSSAPELFIIVVGLWTGVFLFVSLLDRTPRSYVFMLAGYTLPLIALPTVNAPDTIFDVAISRAEEITLGIVCAALVNSLFFPARIGPVLAQQIKGWLRDAGAWASAVLTDGAGTGATPERQRLASDIRAMDMLISQLSYDTANQATVRVANELRGRMALLLPLLSSLDDRLAALHETSGEVAGIEALRARLLDWMRSGEGNERGAADRLLADISALEPKSDPGSDQQAQWPALVLSSTLERMKELVDLWEDCRQLQRQIELGDRISRWRPTFRMRRTVGKVSHYDYALLTFQVGSVVLATILSGLMWIWTGWSEGSGCVIMTAVGCSFFAAIDNPVNQIRSFTVWMTISVGLSAVYLFALLPLAHDYVGLVVMFAVPFILVGTLVSRPQFNMIAMLLAVNTASFVGLQANYSAEFSAFMNSSVASILGGGFALVWTLATRPFGAALVAKRLVRAGWADIAATSRGGRNADANAFAGRVFDRLGQLVPRPAQGVSEDVAAADLLVELRVGINVLDLQRLRGKLSSTQGRRLQQLLDTIARFYGTRAATGRAVDPPASLLGAIDEALSDFAQGVEPSVRRNAVQALVGLRRALFPASPAPVNLAAPAAMPALAELGLAKMELAS